MIIVLLVIDCERSCQGRCSLIGIEQVLRCAYTVDHDREMNVPPSPPAETMDARIVRVWGAPRDQVGMKRWRRRRGGSQNRGSASLLQQVKIAMTTMTCPTAALLDAADAFFFFRAAEPRSRSSPLLCFGAMSCQCRVALPSRLAPTDNVSLWVPGADDFFENASPLAYIGCRRGVSFLLCSLAGNRGG